jgi:hypothetical protein
VTATAFLAQVFLTNPTAIAIKAVEAKPCAERTAQIVCRRWQLAAALAAAMAQIRIVAPCRARCYPSRRVTSAAVRVLMLHG